MISAAMREEVTFNPLKGEILLSILLLPLLSLLIYGLIVYLLSTQLCVVSVTVAGMISPVQRLLGVRVAPSLIEQLMIDNCIQE